jgi:hypothetical protein
VPSVPEIGRSRTQPWHLHICECDGPATNHLVLDPVRSLWLGEKPGAVLASQPIQELHARPNYQGSLSAGRFWRKVTEDNNSRRMHQWRPSR